MRLVLAGVVLLHGLIHLIGPARAYGWADVSALQVPVSRTAGALWLAAALLFVVGSIGLFGGAAEFAQPEWWWAPTLAAIALSQVLIVRSWADAGFGTIANLVIVVPVAIAMLAALPGSYSSEYHREVQSRPARSAARDDVVRQADLRNLPPAVQRYLRFAGVMGRPRVHHFRVRFRGELRSGPDSSWMPSEAEQHGFFDPAARIFLVKSTLYGVPFEALHVFRDSAATMRVKVASAVKVLDVAGPEMNQSETVTLFNDMWLLAPASLIDAPIAWIDGSAETVRASFAHAGQTIGATLSFGADGELTNFVSDDRYRSTDGRTHDRARWSTPISAWGEIDGVRLPVLAEARWTLPAGEFAYARFEIVAVRYNER
jgi:hypothetical protein